MSNPEISFPPPPLPPIPWHRLFGFILDDVMHRLLHVPCEVKLEEDLSQLRQLLDVVIIRRQQLPKEIVLPDGLDLMATHNLITYKSHQEPLNEWAIQELIGHYVNYRKIVSYQIDKDKLLPESDFQLYAVSTRYPQNLKLTKDGKPTLKNTSHDGVYYLDWGRADIRIIVTSEIALTPNNVLWNLFGNNKQSVLHGLEYYNLKESPVSTIIRRLLNYYLNEEKITMSYTIEDFNRDYLPQIIADIMADLPIEERLKGVPMTERLKGVSMTERLKGVPMTERLKGVPMTERLKGVPMTERLKGIPVDEVLKEIPVNERLKGLSPEEIERYLATLPRACGN